MCVRVRASLFFLVPPPSLSLKGALQTWLNLIIGCPKRLIKIHWVLSDLPILAKLNLTTPCIMISSYLKCNKSNRYNVIIWYVRLSIIKTNDHFILDTLFKLKLNINHTHTITHTRRERAREREYIYEFVPNCLFYLWMNAPRDWIIPSHKWMTVQFKFI